ncbi:hypothetical protein [Corallococcus sp. Z5C101001]|uniref:hypothetical protein n=1 Tax=Corallococcus sp. Z5C101001 TaxID=2596829 RepID=UPI0021045299|nr:hypothetical protein [Corallococcus sp. Z5C101001]
MARDRDGVAAVAWFRMAVCVGWFFLVGCEEARTASPRIPVLGEVGGQVAREGVEAHVWSRTLRVGDPQAPHAVMTSNGDVLVAATYQEPIDLGAGPLPFDRGVAAPHLLVARYSPHGALKWAQGWTPRGPARARVGGVAVDATDHLFLSGLSAGFTRGGATLPAGPFLARLDGAGALDWVRSLPGEGPVAVNAVAAAPDGGAVLVGDFSGTRDFGEGLKTAPGARHAGFALRVGPQGEQRWSRVWLPVGEGEVSARAVAVDVFGDVQVVGGYAGAVSFGDATFLTVRQHTPFVVKLDRDGDHLWSHDVRGTDGTAVSVAVGPDRVFVGGGFSGRLYFQDTFHQADSRDGFLLAYDAHGAQRWARTFPTSAPMVATDEAGQVTVAGAHDGGHALGGGDLPPGLYVAKLLPDEGTSLWVRGFASPGTQANARTVSVDSSGGVLLAGGLDRLASDGGPAPRLQDGFVLRLNP